MPPILHRRFLLAVVPAFLAALPTATLAQDPSVDGERLFLTRCGACHSLEPGQNRAGPHLAELADRPAGTVEGARYSNALRSSGMVWNAGALDAFLANPRQAVPGTTMTVSLANAGQRAAIIEFLLSAPSR